MRVEQLKDLFESNKLRRGASEQAISFLEEKLGVRFPKTYWERYRILSDRLRLHDLDLYNQILGHEFGQNPAQWMIA